MKKILYIANKIDIASNTTPYQRINSIGSTFQLDLFLRIKSYPKKVMAKCDSVFVYPNQGIKSSFINDILFTIWCINTFKKLKYNKDTIIISNF